MNDAPLIVESTSRFALDLYRELGGAGGNLFFSPASIAIALTMIHAGARGETAEEIARVMHLPALEPAELHAAFSFLISDMSFENPQPEKATDQFEAAFMGETGPTECLVKMANALWVQAGFRYLQPYADVVRSFYPSELHQVDFKTDAEDARQAINRWVAEHTAGRIPNLVGEGMLSPLDRLVLANAVYFKAQWQEQFEERATSEEPFFVEDGTTIPAQMMHQTEDFRHTQDELAQVLEMNYAGGRFAMLVVLPRDRAGLTALEAGLSFEQLRDWRRKLEYQQVNVTLPKFGIRQSAMLSDTLDRLGIRLAFGNDADFSGITTDPDEQPFNIGQVVHEAFVEVDENGTEAAAATALVVLAGLMDDTETPPVIEFRADHPFLFAVVDKTEGALLFLGRMKVPESGT